MRRKSLFFLGSPGVGSRLSDRLNNADAEPFTKDRKR
jgi:hypothetical protein